MNFDEQDKEFYKDIKQSNEKFKFLAEQVSQQQITSMLPFFECDEPGHGGNSLDQVCLESDCQYKGLSCVRCAYQKHRQHPNSVYPLHTFVSQLISQSQERGIVLDQQLKLCSKYRDVILQIVKDFVSQIVEFSSEFSAQIQRYHQDFIQRFETVLLKSQILISSLIHKKHIKKEQFQGYIKDSISNVSLTRAGHLYRPSSDRYTISEPRLISLDNKMVQETGGLVIQDQEKAYTMSQDYIGTLLQVTTKLENLTKNLQSELIKKGKFTQLNEIMLDNDKTLILNSQTSESIKDLSINYKNSLRNQYNRLMVQAGAPLSQIPNVNEYLIQDQPATQVDTSRTQCTLGIYFENVGNCSILKQKSLKTTQKDINCIVLLGEQILAVGGRFNSDIEFYRMSDRKVFEQYKANTNSKQGVKSMLVMVTPGDIGSYTLVAGLYGEDQVIPSFIVKINPNQTLNIMTSTQFKKPDIGVLSAVSCFKEIYNGEFFITGFTTGTIATFHIQNPEPIQVIKQLYDSPVGGISLIEQGKIYLSWSGEKCRFHYITQLDQTQGCIQSLSPLKQLPQQVCIIQPVQSLNNNDQKIQLIHLICGELKELKYQKAEVFREQGLRFMRIMKDDVKLNLVEEGSVSNFREPNIQTNSVKDIIVIQPRKLISRIWLLVVGYYNKLQLWEVKRTLSQNVKLWEKDLEDFLKPLNTNLIKAKLIGESRENTFIKFSDVFPRAQIVEVKENPSTGRFQIILCLVNHESKNEVDFFNIELMSF